MTTRWGFESCNGSDLPETEKYDPHKIPEVAQQIFEGMLEAGEIYPPDTTWLVLDGEGRLIGEVQAWSGVMASLLASRLWPPQRGERPTVILKQDFQAERN